MKNSFIKYFSLLPLLILFTFAACDHRQTEQTQQNDSVKTQVQENGSEVSAPSLRNPDSGMMVN